jgi:alpha-N-arabinofuranosidase
LTNIASGYKKGDSMNLQGYSRRHATCAAFAALLLIPAAFGGSTPRSDSPTASIVIHADQPGAKIDRHIYGQFAEHLGHGIYEGIWVGEHSSIPNQRGFRSDVIAALKALKVPVVRWPGGCFADEYHWRDGIGPRDQRPVTVNTNWGGVPESNQFGTHEFMDFVELIGADAYINGNLGTGSPREMAEWLQYLTSDQATTITAERARNGHPKPWKVAYFAVGNETWGCGGNMSPDFYVNLLRQTLAFLKTPPGAHPQIIASGGHDADMTWSDVLSAKVPESLDAISFHYYTLPGNAWAHKGAAVGFGEDQWISTFAHTLTMDEYIEHNVSALERNDPNNKIALAVDEWGTWYDTEPGREPGFLYQQNTLRDALVAAVNFNIFHHHAGRVRLANIAQMVNVLQAMILTDGAKMVLTPTYHVFALFQPFQDATSLATEVTTPNYELGGIAVPAMSASAARSPDGSIVVALVNLDPHRPLNLAATLTGVNAKIARGTILSGTLMDSHNTFDSPHSVEPQAFNGARLKDGALSLSLPPKSVLVLTLK